MDQFAILLGMPGSAEWIFMLFGLAYLVFWIKTIVEIATAKFNDDSSKLVWLLVVILLGLIGMVLYYIIGRKKRVIS
ncbi:MAG: PLDc N-terminal domain-containing protein [Chitinophagaceae bacterium]|nr:PLDc N-terminal domain-containing protein [Chitinophagaceae bacterium]